MINIYEVTETNQMILHENLDVRTITLGISLMDCIDSDLDKLNEKIYIVKVNKSLNLTKYKTNFNFINHETVKKQNNCSSSSNSTMLMLSDRHPK